MLSATAAAVSDGQRLCSVRIFDIHVSFVDDNIRITYNLYEDFFISFIKRYETDKFNNIFCECLYNVIILLFIAQLARHKRYAIR